MSYVFSDMMPPLMSDDFDIRNIYKNLLRKDIGASSQSFMTDTPIGVFDGNMKVVRRFNHLSVTRYKYRSIIESIFHPPSLTRETRKYNMGYSDTQKREFEKTASTDIHAGVTTPFFNMSAEAKDQLRIDEATTQTWDVSTERDITWTYNADTTYVTWGLYDELYAVRDASLQMLDTPGMNVMYGLPPEHSASNLSCLLNVYLDHISDADRKILLKNNSLAELSPSNMSILSRSA